MISLISSSSYSSCIFPSESKGLGLTKAQFAGMYLTAAPGICLCWGLMAEALTADGTGLVPWPKAVNLPTLAVRSRPQRHDHLKGQFEHWAFGGVLLHMRTVGDPLSPHPLLSSRNSQVPKQCSTYVPCILDQAHA